MQKTFIFWNKIYGLREAIRKDLFIPLRFTRAC